MTTPNGAPEWASGQASPDVTVNEAMRRTEAGANRYVAADKDLTAPPGSCADGATYIVAGSPTGAWSGHAKDLAVAVGVDAASGWYFRTPTEGVSAYVQDEDVTYTYSGSAWAIASAGSVAYSGITGLPAAIDALDALTPAASRVPYFTGASTAALLTLDTDGTLAANSDTTLATQKAVKTYVANAVAGLLDLKGDQDCSANPNYPAALKGDAYYVSVAGKIGGASGKSVDVGDVFIASADNAGGTEASVGTSWFALEHNLIAALTGAVASTTEQLTGTDNAKLSTPDSVAALWEQGADVASAGTVSLGEGGYFNITGTTTITDVDFATDKAGRRAWVKFAGILTLTYNASTLILPTGASIATEAGDTAEFVSEGSDVVRCVAYTRASGQALAGSSSYNDEMAQDAVGAMLDASLTYVDATPSLGLATNQKLRAVTFVIDGGGATISTGIKRDVYMPYTGTIIAAILLADQSGSIVVDLWKDTYANYPPTLADTITASAKPTLSTALKSKDSTLTGWTTAITADDIIRPNVDSCTSIQAVTVILIVRVT